MLPVAGLSLVSELSAIRFPEHLALHFARRNDSVQARRLSKSVGHRRDQALTDDPLM
jgi:hypothetical protein